MHQKVAPPSRRVTPALRIKALTVRIMVKAHRMVAQVHLEGAVVSMIDTGALKDYNSASVLYINIPNADASTSSVSLDEFKACGC